jgi:hypothetical protein
LSYTVCACVVGIANNPGGFHVIVMPEVRQSNCQHTPRLFSCQYYFKAKTNPISFEASAGSHLIY